MGKLIANEFLTLDGVMQAPGGSDEDTAEGFKHGGWQMPYVDEVFGQIIFEGLDKMGAMLLGRTTYEIFAAYWPDAGGDEIDFAEVMNSTTKYVVSRTLDKAEWQNSVLLKGDVSEEVAKIKQKEDKDILVIGSGGLAQTLMKHNLIDEYMLMVHPLVLGSGKKLFREGCPKQELELIENKPTSTGVIVLRYKTIG